jgi:hypothetical protein
MAATAASGVPDLAAVAVVPVPPPPPVALPPPPPVAVGALPAPLVGAPAGIIVNGHHHAHANSIDFDPRAYNWCEQCRLEDGVIEPRRHRILRFLEWLVIQTCARPQCHAADARKVWLAWVMVVSLATFVIVLVYASLYAIRDVISVPCTTTSLVIGGRNCSQHGDGYVCLQTYRRVTWYLPNAPPPNGTQYHQDIAITGGECSYHLVPTIPCNVNSTILLSTGLSYLGMSQNCWVSGDTGEYYQSFVLSYISEGETIHDELRKYRNTMIPMLCICVFHICGTCGLIFSLRCISTIKRWRRKAIRRAVEERHAERQRIAQQYGNGIIYTREQRHRYHTSSFVPFLFGLRYPHLRHRHSSLSTLVNDPLYDSHAVTRLIGAFSDHDIARTWTMKEHLAVNGPPPAPSDQHLFTLVDAPMLPLTVQTPSTPNNVSSPMSSISATSLSLPSPGHINIAMMTNAMTPMQHINGSRYRIIVDDDDADHHRMNSNNNHTNNTNCNQNNNTHIANDHDSKTVENDVNFHFSESS